MRFLLQTNLIILFGLFFLNANDHDFLLKKRMAPNVRQRFIDFPKLRFFWILSSRFLETHWKSVFRLMRRASFFETGFYYTKFDFLQFIVVLTIGYLICILLLYLTYMVSCVFEIRVLIWWPQVDPFSKLLMLINT